MDKTETYFKMSNCPEIQSLHTKWEEGDYYTVQKGGAVGMVFVYPGEKTEDEPPKMYDPIWLPTQDRLQEMLFGEFDNPIYKAELFVTFHKTWRWLDLMTMEQLWLTFYMYQVHGKTWDGEKWMKKVDDAEKERIKKKVKDIRKGLKPSPSWIGQKEE